jgi:uncharacterized cupredoxin-like copper-binding protein
MTSITRRAAAAALLGLPWLARAHGDMKHAAAAPAKAEQTDWGIAGDARAARRTVEIRMTDAMRFAPATIKVRPDETVRFVVHNDGRLMHEFVIGTPAALDEHAALMVRFPDMEHDAPYMAHVPPAGRAEVVWRFNRGGDVRYACLIAGHYQAGMVGRIEWEPS